MDYNKLTGVPLPISLYMEEGSGTSGDAIGLGCARVDRKKVKRRAADVRVKKFHGKYKKYKYYNC